jgi:secreted trypsin-like serine protease
MSNWEGENIAMAKIIVHPDWNPSTFDNDLAIVVLEEATSLDVSFSQLNSDDSYPSIGANSRVMGWGTTSEGGFQSDVLLEVDLPIISNEDCNQCYVGQGTISTNMMCAFNPGFDSCQGDSGGRFDCIVQLTILIDYIQLNLDSHPYLFSLGGPLIVSGETQDEDIQIGVVSWGIGCAQAQYPGVYSRISIGFDWIKRNACKESLSPPSNLCDGSYAPTPFVTNAPSTGPVEGFTYFGEGYCLDSENQDYSYFGTYLSDANHNDCLAWCSQVQHPDFVGVEVDDYGDGTMECFCDFSGSLPEDVNRTDYSPVAWYISYHSGVGPVQNTTGTSGVSCYQYDVSFLGCMSGFLLCIASYSLLHLLFT